MIEDSQPNDSSIDEPLPPSVAYAPVAPAGGFWQQPMVQDVLPLITSLAVHLGIFLLGWATYEAVASYRQTVEEQIIIPDAAMVEGATVGGVPNPGLGDDPTRPAAQQDLVEAQPTETWQRSSESLKSAVLGDAGESQLEANTAIGPGSSGSLFPGGGTSATGSGRLGLDSGGGGLGPKTSFVGVSGNARRVAYICDATGSMVGIRFELLKREIYKALDILKPSQAYNVIFFRGGESDKEWSQSVFNELVFATPQNNQRSRDFIKEFYPVGKENNPLPALRNAFRQKPQLIYFLTDGEFNYLYSYEQILAEVRKLNSDNRVKVVTIFLTNRTAGGPVHEEMKQTEQALRDLAEQNNGRFVVVTERDLQN